MLEMITSLFASSGFGAIIGAVGGWAMRKAELEKIKVDNQFKLESRRLDLQEATEERAHELGMADKQMQRARIEGDVQEGLIEADAFRASIAQAAKATGIAFVDAVRGLMRPVITMYLLIVTTYIAIKLASLVGGLDAFSPQEAFELYRDVILQCIGLTAVAVSWWFASRPSTSTKAG